MYGLSVHEAHNETCYMYGLSVHEAHNETCYMYGLSVHEAHNETDISCTVYLWVKQITEQVFHIPVSV
jgi:hypothetical protein